MKALYRQLTHTTRHYKLPRLQGRFKNPVDPSELDEDNALILLAGIARDEYEAEKLLKKAKTSAVEFLKRLPKRRIDYMRRVRAWLRSLEGAYESDPHSEEYREAKRIYGGKNERFGSF